jgi:hypothetical protein
MSTSTASSPPDQAGDELSPSEAPPLSAVKPVDKVALTGTACEVFEACVSDDDIGTSAPVPVLALCMMPAVAASRGCQGEECSELQPCYLCRRGIKARAFYVDNALTPEECALLRGRIDGCDALSFWNETGRENEDARMFRDADTIELHSTLLALKMWIRVQPLLQLEPLHIAREEDDDEGNRDPRWERDLFGSWQPSALNPDMLFAKYPSFGSFAPHTDGRAIESFNSRSFYSVIVYLNTIPAPGGGGTRFYSFDAVQRLRSASSASGSKVWTSDPNLALAEVLPVAGRMLVFEQSLVHEGVPPAPPHLKYIIRSDVMFQRTPAICDSPADVAAYALLMKVSCTRHVSKSIAARVLIPSLSVARLKQWRAAAKRLRLRPFSAAQSK